jgi:hypothetical protein
MSVTIILEVSKTAEVTGHNVKGLPVGNTHFHVHPYLEGVELEENVMGEDRPTYHRTCEVDLSFATPALDATLYAVLEDAYKNERDYVEGIGETLMKVEVHFAHEADGADFTMYSMTGKGTPCAMTEEYKALKKLRVEIAAS